MVALMAVTFVQPNDTALAGSPSEVCPNRMDVAVNGQTVQLPYCSNKLLDTPDPSVKRAVIVVHGSSRNAEDYYPRMRDAAKMAGALDESIILAPQFFEDEDKGTFKLDQTNIPYWDGGWREGDPSVSPKTPKVSSYAMLDEMIKRLTNRSTFPNLQRVVVTGHSAGGQFTQRYAAGNQVEQQTVQPTPRHMSTSTQIGGWKGVLISLPSPRPAVATTTPTSMGWMVSMSICKQWASTKSGRNTPSAMSSICSEKKIH
jgi:hypothetical protein